jgi:uncharacterized protein
MGGLAPLGSAPPELAPAERFDWTQLPARPWKNGAGLTREIASSPRGATLDDFYWRLSVAEVAVNGPFSAYAGIDRTIALLRGAGMRLRSDDGRLDHRLDTVAAPFGFDGEAAIQATLLGGACSDFNVMTRRGRCSAKVQAVTTDTVLAPADALLLLCVNGAWKVSTGKEETLLPAQGLLWRQPVAHLHVSPTFERIPSLEAQRQEAACLIAVRLCQHHSP